MDTHSRNKDKYTNPGMHTQIHFRNIHVHIQADKRAHQVLSILSELLTLTASYKQLNKNLEYVGKLKTLSCDGENIKASVSGDICTEKRTLPFNIDEKQDCPCQQMSVLFC